MRSYQVHEHGAPSTLKIDEIPAPVPGKGELLVNVEAAGVNFPDVLVISGEYQLLPPRPFTPGKDLAGVVAAVGEGVEGYAVGDRVMSQIEWGALAEQAITTPAQSFHLPEGMSFNEAAAMGLVYQTAYFALVERGQYQTGQTVLIGGAAGGVGLAAVQIAKGLGAKVLACVRNEAEAQVVRKSGADHVIDLSRDNLKESVRAQVFAVTDGKGADVVLDPLGGEFFAGALRAVAWCGRIVVIGFAAGTIPQLKVNYLLLKNIGVCGVQWTDYRDRTPGKVLAAQKELFRLWREGVVRPRIMRQFAFEEASEALELIRQGKVQGKVVVSVNQEKLA
ncbi:NADPH:quinone oxidoreductase family protein [Pseudomonas veronii]|jgi:NADPH2:quinone reductase|uniref:NADPH:quinone oxidoreductase family protein n=1 Tax=Pseudomonas veronii TaxID=76761 RepID=A0A7Y1FB71_PSEVE|nr:NADPH:quinone oxidoreductase family protein [Pseudomonas veronii]NMY11903.1 NADPH:quinone oxidoreductase family protein [Pseudomonas veronii]